MASKADLEIQQGNDYAAQVDVFYGDTPTYPSDLEGYTSEAHIRLGAAQYFPGFGVISTSIVLPNHVILFIPHDQTLLLTAPQYVWDLTIISPFGGVTTILAGRANVSRAVTVPEEDLPALLAEARRHWRRATVTTVIEESKWRLFPSVLTRY